MPITAVIGGQWGDEGKGKIVDLLCEEMHVVARYQGGANAGHTVKINDETIILHQIPSGILHPEIVCILGHGMVVDPVALAEELETLAKQNINTEGRIQISLAAHIVTPVHKAMDRATGLVIGTTLRGIGPAYTDKARRLGIRAVDLLDLSHVEEYLRNRVNMSVQQGEIKPEELDTMQDEIKLFLESASLMIPMLEDTISTLHQAIADGRNILFEGAQGTLLDIDMGTYPFVTSSNPTAAGIATGLGVPARSIDRLIGIFKAYNTRVGGGPFPTELTNETGDLLQKQGAEFGATTGRPRRCGWFDAVAAQYSCRVNGFTEIALTKLDVLDQFTKIKVCTAYDLNGSQTISFSAVNHELALAKPVYLEMPGWQTDISSIRCVKDLPKEARDYILQLESLMETPIVRVSVGPERSQFLTL
ncbi:adenylosuccinate synthase [Candidatus Neomarinimicrobiota bacterium]